MSAQVILILQLGLLLVNCVLLIVSLTIYFNYRNNKKQQTVMNEQYMLKAQQDARGILENAVMKAKQILSETNYVREGLFRDMEAGLQQAAQQHITQIQNQHGQLDQYYRSLLEAIKNEHLQKTDEAIKNVNQITQASMQDFRQILSKETLQAEDLVTKRVNNEYIEVHKQLETYRQQKIAEIDKQVRQLIVQTTQSILGKTIPLEEHEKLIIQALEQAKKEGLILSAKST